MTHTDPVCDMQVDEKDAAATTQYNGKQYYFCSEDCKQQFDRDPEEYAKKTA